MKSRRLAGAFCVLLVSFLPTTSHSVPAGTAGALDHSSARLFTPRDSPSRFGISFSGVGGPANAPRKVASRRRCASCLLYCFSCRSLFTGLLMETMVFFSRGELDVERFHDLMEELNTSSDRAVAILGGSLVEVSLTSAILAHLHRNKKITDELFNTTGALGAFATKIHLGLLVGMYGEGGHKELSIIKDIRNRFAHSLTVKDFKTQQIKDWTKNLKFGERYATDGDAPIPKKEDLGPASPIGERDWWFSVKGLGAALANPRERFLISVQTLTYALSVPLHPAMPKPFF